MAVLPTPCCDIKECRLIDRPVDLVYRKVKIVFNDDHYNFIEVDINHINKNKRSNYSIGEIEKLAVALIQQTFANPVGARIYGGESCEYYAVEKDYFETKYRLVFSICSDRPDVLGIMTLFRMGVKK